ncbi:vWA domain-containing protein [Dinoroseobacter sp. S76]|uniref:vWA domain-containing protein n=1 Tax=Dinoroseobacter sp. S76 TaxID=3415124 RepID=UPI003C7BF595
MTVPFAPSRIRARLLASLTLIGVSLVGAPPSLHAAQGCSEDAIVVFDGSGSMSEMGFNLMDEPRIFAARRAVRRAMPQVAPFRNLGLLIYGPGPREACSNIDLRFAPIPDAAPRMIAEIDALAPSGNTPLTASVARAAEALGYRDRAGVVVLVTDGKETCGGAPCQLAASLSAEAHDLTVHVIGFKLRGEHFSWDSENQHDYREGQTVARCLADQTGGLYLTTETVDELITALQTTLGCPIFGRGPDLSGGVLPG